MKLEGFLTKPAVSRKSIAGLYLHVNGRPIQARNICYSIRGAYGSLLHEGHFPVGALFLEIPAEDVDVNVHPAKTIVRIAREEKINKELRTIIKQVLSEQALIANVDLEKSKNDVLFGMPSANTAVRSRVTPVTSIDSFQVPTVGGNIFSPNKTLSPQQMLSPTVLPNEDDREIAMRQQMGIAGLV